MEKEMKKLLLVAVSVGVFLLVTITVAIIILTPKVQTQGTSFSSSVPYSQRVQPDSNIMDNIPIQPAVIEATDKTSDIDAEADTDNGDSLTIQIPEPSRAAVPYNTEITPPTVTIAPSPAAPEPASVKPAQPAQTTAASRQTTAKPAAPAPASTARPAPARPINDYWVQTGAYSAIVRAEDVKEILASKGLTSIIETRVVEGKNLYRVRLGPYTSEREAGYWLALVKSIDGFGESQIRQTTRQR